MYPYTRVPVYPCAGAPNAPTPQDNGLLRASFATLCLLGRGNLLGDPVIPAGLDSARHHEQPCLASILLAQHKMTHPHSWASLENSKLDEGLGFHVLDNTIRICGNLPGYDWYEDIAANSVVKTVLEYLGTNSTFGSQAVRGSQRLNSIRCYYTYQRRALRIYQSGSWPR